MCKFTQQELEEIFRMLERAGMNPMWCDTPVPYYDVNIPAGIPTDIEMRSSLNSKYQLCMRKNTHLSDEPKVQSNKRITTKNVYYAKLIDEFQLASATSITNLFSIHNKFKC